MKQTKWLVEIRQSIRQYKLHSFFLRNILFISLSILIPLLSILIVVYGVSKQITLTEIQKLNDDTLLNFSRNVDNYLNNGHVVCSYLLSQVDYDSMPERTDYEPEIEYIEYGRSLSELIRTFSDAIEFSESITLLDNVHQTYYSSTGEFGTYTHKSGFFHTMKPLSYDREWLLVQRDNLSPVMTYAESDQGITVTVSVPVSSIQRIAGNIVPQPFELQITDLNGTVLYQTASFESFVKEKGDWGFVTSTLKNETYGLSYELLKPTESFSGSYQFLSTILLVLSGCSIVLVVVVSFIITVRIFRPIGYLTGLIQKTQDYPDWQNTKMSGTLDEIQFLASNIEKQSNYNQTLEEKISDLKMYQSFALQSQIDSHFLFNALENINWEAMLAVGAGNRVSKMVDTLSKLLRLGLDNTSTLISIEEELEHVKLYMEMQRYRYEGRFTVSYEVQPSLFEQKVLKLSLQPIVENIFKHGMKNAQTPLTIRVTGYQTGNNLVVEIWDNGTGISPQKLEELRKNITTLDRKDKQHIGLANLSKRLYILYGQTDGLTVESRQGEYTLVRIRYKCL